MKIQGQDFYHGAALMQITEHKSFKALNKADTGNYGHYLINTDRHVFVKYRTSNGNSWNHVLSADEVAILAKTCEKERFVWLSLVCGSVTICALDKTEIETVIDLDQAHQQWIKVEVPNRGSCHVTGSIGALGRVIPHNSFPAKLFV